jgi:rRNA maturation protein Nop10
MPVDDKTFTLEPACPVCGKNLAPPGAGMPQFCPSCGSDTQQPSVKARRRDPRLKFTKAEGERRRKHGG